jgi:hypothetical protein
MNLTPLLTHVRLRTCVQQFVSALAIPTQDRHAFTWNDDNNFLRAKRIEGTTNSNRTLKRVRKVRPCT